MLPLLGLTIFLAGAQGPTPADVVKYHFWCYDHTGLAGRQVDRALPNDTATVTQEVGAYRYGLSATPQLLAGGVLSTTYQVTVNGVKGYSTVVTESDPPKEAYISVKQNMVRRHRVFQISVVSTPPKLHDGDCLFDVSAEIVHPDTNNEPDAPVRTTTAKGRTLKYSLSISTLDGVLTSPTILTSENSPATINETTDKGSFKVHVNPSLDSEGELHTFLTVEISDEPVVSVFYPSKLAASTFFKVSTTDHGPGKHGSMSMGNSKPRVGKGDYLIEVKATIGDGKDD